jgi:rRNA maturation RNase YbeY
MVAMGLPATAVALLPALLVPRISPMMALTTGSGVKVVKLVVGDQLSNEPAMASEEEMVFDELPAPLERVLLSEQGSAVGRGWASAVEQDACALLGAAGLDDGEQLSLMLCDDETIRELNCRWREVDKATDVLSFPMDDPQLLGDLVISLDTAERQAKERSIATRDELRVLMVHGVLHLLGYDHEDTPEEHEEMRAAESKLLTRLGWAGSGLIAAADKAE